MTHEHAQRHILEQITEGTVLPAAVESHLKHCEPCHAYQTEMTDIFRFDDGAAPDPGPDYFDRLWQSVEPELTQPVAVVQWLQSPMIRNIAVAAVLLIIGMSVGMQLVTPSSTVKTTVAETRIEDEELLKTFRRTKVLMTNFSNMDEYETAEMSAMLSTSASQLLAEIAELKREYAAEPEISLLLKRMERILMMISTINELDPGAVKQLQEGSRQDDVVEDIITYTI